MNESFTRTFRDRSTKNTYRIRFEWCGETRLLFWTLTSGHYRMFVEDRPDCRFELGMSAHLRAEEEICVLEGREPQTQDRARAIALLWIRGFSIYRKTGTFPNGGGRVNVADS